MPDPSGSPFSRGRVQERFGSLPNAGRLPGMAPAGRSSRAPGDRDSAAVPGSLQSQLTTAQGDLQGRLDARLANEIKLLTTRYSGDAALAEQVARGRMSRDFAASDPTFAGEIAPMRAKVADLEEQVRRAATRRGAGVIGINGGESLGGN